MRFPHVPLAALLLTLLAACSAPQPAEDPAKEALRHDIVLATQLMGVADLAQSITRDDLSRLLLADAPGEHVAYAARVHAGVTSTLQGFALDPTPKSGLARMYVWCRIGQAACANRLRLNPRYAIDDCDRVYVRLQAVIDAIAVNEMTPRQRAGLDELIARYLAAHPDVINAGFLRIDDIADSKEAAELVLPPTAPSMLSPVADATRQLELMRFLGMQLLWVAARTPEVVGAHVQAESRILMHGPELQGFFQSAVRLGERIDETHASLETLAKTHERLGGRIEELAGAIGEVADRADRGITMAAWFGTAAGAGLGLGIIMLLRAFAARR